MFLYLQPAEAESKAFTGAWALQYHYFRDPFAVLAAIASATSTISLGTAITNVSEKHPLAVGMSAATIHELSKGRMILGLGTGTPQRIKTEMGLSYEKPHLIMEEAVALIRSFLSGEQVSWNGQFFHVNGATLGWEPSTSKIPIYLAAMGPKSLGLASKVADGVVLNYGTTPSYVSHAVSEIKRHRKDFSGFDITSLIWVVPDETERSLIAAKRTLAAFLSNPGFGENVLPFTEEAPNQLELIRRFHYLPEGRVDIQSAAQLISDQLLRSVMIIGESNSESRLRDYMRAGIQHPILVPLGGYDQIQRTVKVYSD